MLKNVRTLALHTDLTWTGILKSKLQPEYFSALHAQSVYKHLLVEIKILFRYLENLRF